MSRTYSRFRVNQFPAPAEKDSVIVRLGENHLHGKKEQTRITAKGTSGYGDFEKYSIYHEFVRHAEGRTYDGQDFNEFYQKNTFDGFYSRSRRELICGASKRASRSLIDALNEKAAQRFNFDHLKVDFEIVKGRMQNVRGIWLSNMSQPFLDTVSLFGKNVQQSDWYRAAEQCGEASSFLIFYLYNEVTFPIILSVSCSITFLRPDPEPLYFEVMEHIDKTLLEGAVITQDSKFNERKKKAEAKTAAKGKAGPQAQAALGGLFPPKAGS